MKCFYISQTNRLDIRQLCTAIRTVINIQLDVPERYFFARPVSAEDRRNGLIAESDKYLIGVLKLFIDAIAAELFHSQSPSLRHPFLEMIHQSPNDLPNDSSYIMQTPVIIYTSDFSIL